jgi:hypothetical protein
LDADCTSETGEPKKSCAIFDVAFITFYPPKSHTKFRMDSAQQKAEALRRQIAETESELAFLKLQLSNIEGKVSAKETTDQFAVSKEDYPVTHGRWPLSLEEYKRYGRQMIVPDIGIQGYSSLFIPLGNIC